MPPSNQSMVPRDRETRGLPSTAAIFGHPVHPMIVPYPVAFLTAALATGLEARATWDPFRGGASGLVLGACILTGTAAGAVGAIDYYTIRRVRTAAGGAHPIRWATRWPWASP